MTNWRDQLQLDGEGPVYDQIRQAILSRIRSGSWAPGYRLPSEADLCDHFGTARMTVSRALRSLTEDGLVIRKRRAGSFVAQPDAPAALLKIIDMASAIPARGQRYGYQCLGSATIPAGEDTARQMRLLPGARVQHVRCLHSADGQPVELEERWINLALLPDVAQADFTAEGPGGWLLRQTPWTEAEHTVSAVNADPVLAACLGIEPGAACLVLERRTFQGDDVVTLARLTHPGDRHVMSERFAP
ncbi:MULTISPECIES: histidine utilization repressor [Maricaulis]|jgi:GntR family histidine utilization transcriptional repressor|uniref:Histidine utilization repressor n=1 Tax=Maricaulis maris (strain MCS10) TaxID=394221 RepID=Q0AP89_MARMM|nr:MULTISPECIES: histidine utilization repressor [Maricaulis]ABI65898.1 transcriptional regulator, histidine utilization repressor, GntR family [Maricaulis maris MCS10]MAC89166.1 histidine utilization repressor [Maricaulis sp.]